MIQRKQTLFLLVAAILGLVFWLSWPLFVIQAFASVLSLYTIFIYKKRPLQAKLCLVTILIHFLSIVACFPLIAAILCFMARKAILADERLVRAADRIR